jgi:hypothetical protein
MQQFTKILVVSALSFVSSSGFGETAALASLDLLSDASAFVADEANVETSEGKPDAFAAPETGAAELSIDINAQSVTNNSTKVP